MTDRATIGHGSGKVILLGEHAVVYGVPAIAVGIDRGARAMATRLTSGPSRLHVRGWDITVTDDQTEPPLGRAFGDLLVATRARQAQAGKALGPVSVEAEADLPAGGGLGCSAAIGVAIARAVDPAAVPSEIAARVMEWEKVFHGNPSGIDAEVSASGGCVYFEKGSPIASVRVRGGLLLCVGHTGIASSTKAMVEAVARLRGRRPHVAENVFDGIRALVKGARGAIEAGDRGALGSLMDLNQMLLSALLVSSEEIEHMCTTARMAGALGAKLTGAGGGGSVVALVASAERAERVVAAWTREGFTAFTARVSAHEELSTGHVTESAP